jgi:hypothetical protein
MTRQELFDRVDAMIIYEKDYETLLNLLYNTDDRFFVKILEEILEGNLYISDFERLFSDDAYTDTLRMNLDSQDKIYKEITRLLDYRRNILGEDFSIDPMSMIGIVKQDTESQYKNLYDQLADDARRNLVYQALKTIPSDNIITASSKLKIFQKMQDGTISIEDFILFANSQIIPVSIEHQVLDESDLNFMIENNLSHDEVRKLKALSIFLRRKNFEGGL